MTSTPDPFRWQHFGKRVEDLLNGMEGVFLAILAEDQNPSTWGDVGIGQEWPEDVPPLEDSTVEVERCADGHTVAKVNIEMCEHGAEKMLNDLVRTRMLGDPESMNRVLRWAEQVVMAVISIGIDHLGWKED